VVKCERNCDRDLKKRSRITYPANQENAGAFVNNETNPIFEQQGFRTEDILWALGIWSVILALLPVIVFYMLMVA
jgi:hypothetical protein